MSMSERDSGETESVAELSGAVVVLSKPTVAVICSVPLFTWSNVFLTSFAEIVVLEICFFFCCGFIAGDALTDLAGVLIEFVDILRRDLRTELGGGMDVALANSRL